MYSIPSRWNAASYNKLERHRLSTGRSYFDAEPHVSHSGRRRRIICRLRSPPPTTRSYDLRWIIIDANGLQHVQFSGGIWEGSFCLWTGDTDYEEVEFSFELSRDFWESA